MEIKTEADSFSMTECSHDAEPSTGMFGYYYYFFSVFASYGPLLCIVNLRWYVFCLLVVELSCQYLPSDWLERLL